VPRIRPYRPSDRVALDDICIRTADAGRDARSVYEDPSVLPEIFAAPYAYLEPGLAFVLAVDSDPGESSGDGFGTAVGYVVGTADTAAFVRRFRNEWLPLVGHRYPNRTTRPTTPDEVMADLLHAPERMIMVDLAGYPAHLHIDLLPGYQRAGYGRALVETFIVALRRADVPALHVAMVTANHAARPFYDRLGFHVIDVADAGPLTYLGLRL
jgi:GNAT superfamily N-acetyltransferase